MKTVSRVDFPQCKFIERKKNGKEFVGKLCGNRLLNDEDKCPDHKNEISNDLQLYPWTCKFVISQTQGKDRERSRKGADCGILCSEGNLYCKNHLKCANIVVDVPDENSKIKKEIITVIRCFKVRAYLNKNQRAVYKKFAGDCRKTYNMLVSRQDEIQDETFITLRSEFVTNKNLENTSLSYLTKTPKSCRDSAVKEFLTGRDNAIDRYEKRIQSQEEYKQRCIEEKEIFFYKEIKKPRMKFKKKMEDQSVAIDKMAVTLGKDFITIFPRYFRDKETNVRASIGLQGRIKKDKKYSQLLENGLKHDIKLLKTRTGKFYFAIPYDVPLINTPKDFEFGSSDGGVKDFMNTCNVDGETRAFGEGVDYKIKHYHDKIDRLKCSIPRHKAFNRWDKVKKCKRLIIQLNEKLRNKVIDLHFKTIPYIVAHKKFYLPKFNSKQMVEQKTTFKATKRQMNQLSHYQFSLRLKSKAEVVGCDLSISDEFRTTQVCDQCLRRNFNVGLSRYFQCEYCSWELDRDEHSARGNVLKYLNKVN